MPKSTQDAERAIEEIESMGAAPSNKVTENERHRRIQSAWAIFWVAFGDVLGSLRSADDAVMSIEYSLPVPRAFAIPENATIDRVRDMVQHAERELNLPADTPSLAERNVATLVQCLEPLVRRVWEKEFKTTRKDRFGNSYSPGLRQVLRVVRERFPESSDEHRFATTSLSLYEAYRCKVSHDLESFHCSIEEARYVLASIRMLMKLSDDLKRRHNP